MNSLPSPKEVDFEALVHEHQGTVYQVALRVLRDPAGAEDVAQQVFLRLFHERGLPAGAVLPERDGEVRPSGALVRDETVWRDAGGRADLSDGGGSPLRHSRLRDAGVHRQLPRLQAAGAGELLVPRVGRVGTSS